MGGVDRLGEDREGQGGTERARDGGDATGVRANGARTIASAAPRATPLPARPETTLVAPGSFERPVSDGMLLSFHGMSAASSCVSRRACNGRTSSAGAYVRILYSRPRDDVVSGVCCVRRVWLVRAVFLTCGDDMSRDTVSPRRGGVEYVE